MSKINSNLAPLIPRKFMNNYSGRKPQNSSAVLSKSILLDKITEFTLGLPEFKNELKAIAENIRARAKRAPNEATIASHFETLLYAFLKQHFGIEFLPEKEIRVETARHTGKGRMDSRLGALIIEYKHYTKLAGTKDQHSASNQIIEYMQSIGEESGQEVIGFITDGLNVKFISYDPITNVSQGAFEAISAEHIERLIRSIVLLEKTALTPENLVKDFCAQNGVAQKLSITLFDALKNNISDRSMMLFNEWKALFKLAHDDTSKQVAIEDRRIALAAALGISISVNDNETEYMALYAIQTAYAIIVKIIAYKVITAVRAETSIISFGELAGANVDTIRTHLYRLEEGEIFRDIGFGNLLEGDFFAWYCTDKQWNANIAACVKQVFAVLTEYEDHKIFSGDDVHIQDLFKDLYMHVIPDKVRHSLGEFYTPPWLADNLVSRAIELADKNDWKGLDPCCGSGTFITVLMRRVLEESRGKSRKAKLKAVLTGC